MPELAACHLTFKTGATAISPLLLITSRAGSPALQRLRPVG